MPLYMKANITLHKRILIFVKRKISIVLVAFMLGMSNVILEETRMINDSRAEIELQEVQDNDVLK